MNQVASVSLKFRVLVVGLAAVVMALTAAQLPGASVDALPEFRQPEVQIQTEALGLSAAEVEQLITVPMEQNLLNGVAWLDQIHSESAPGLSSVELIFKPGTDLLKARQVVQERMARADTLANVGTPPVVIQPVSSASRVMMVGLSSKDLSLMDLSILARWKIKPRLMGVPGVSNVAVWGQRERQLQVQVNPERLRQNGVTLSQIMTSTGNALWVSPLTFLKASTPGTGGFFDTQTQRFTVQHVLPIQTAGDLSSVVIEGTGGRRLRLGQVADVVEDHQPLIGDAVLSTGPGLMLVIQKFPGANTREVTDGVLRALDGLRPGMSGVDFDTGVYQAQDYIRAALLNLGIWALAALGLLFGLLALVVSWRVAVITTVTILLSLTAAAYVLYLTGTGFNSMVLTGLAVALGVIIGGAVIDVVSIRRRLREHREAGGTGSASSVVAGTSAAARGPLTSAALIVIVAPLPLLFVQGAPGFFSRPAVLAYVLAVTASLVVALTVVPALALMLLRNEPPGRGSRLLVRWSDRLFTTTVPRFVRRRGWAYATMVLLLVVACAAVPQLQGRSLFASPHDRTLVIHVATVSGTSLPEMERITNKLSQELRSVRGVRQVGSHVGRAVTGDQVVNVNSGEMWVGLADSASYDATAAAVRRVLDGYPGVRSDLLSYPEDRVRAAQARTKEGLVVRLYGQDLGVLRSKAEEIRTRLSTVQGVVRPRVQAKAEEPTLVVEVNLAAAQRYGLNPGDVRRTAATFYSGLLVGNLYEEQKVFDVMVQGVPSTHSTLNIADLLVEVPAGGHVRLGDVAKVQVAPYPTVISHDAASRSLDVTAEVSGWDLGAVLREVGKRVRSVPMPVEYRAEVLSDLAEQQSQDIRVAAVAIAAAIAILLLLQATFSSWRLAALVFLTLPLSAAGGVVTALSTGGIMTLGAMAGLFAVLGVAAPSIILLVRGYQIEDATRGTDPNAASVLGATREAAGPILLTACLTGVVLLPLLLLGSVAGTEILHPLAAVVLGGLVSSTVVALLLVPALYLRLSPASRADRPRTETASGQARHQPRTSQAVTD